MKTIAIFSLTSALIVSAANAQVTKTEKNWYCGKRAEWRQATLNIDNKLTINNFVFQEGERTRSKRHVLILAFSLTNRDPRRYYMSAQLFGLNRDGSLSFAATVQPDWDYVARGTETAKTEVLVPKRTLEKTTTICAFFTIA